MRLARVACGPTEGRFVIAAGIAGGCFKLSAQMATIGRSYSNNCCIFVCELLASTMSLRSWILSANDDLDFTIHNIPFGLISTADNARTRPATRLGSSVIDLSQLSGYQALIDGLSEAAMASLQAVSASDLLEYSWLEKRHQPTLELMASLPVGARRGLRLAIQKVFIGEEPSDFPKSAILEASEVQMHVPMRIGDYTDFCIAWVLIPNIV